MAMGRQKDGQGDLMVSWSEMPRSPGHVFYDRLQSVLIEGGFDAFAEATHGGDRGCGDGHCEEVAHEFGQALLGNELGVQQVAHPGGDAWPVLDRGGHAVREDGSCHGGAGAAVQATASGRRVAPHLAGDRRRCSLQPASNMTYASSLGAQKSNLLTFLERQVTS